MDRYIKRLINCGYSPSDAYMIYWDFIKELSMRDLDELLSSLEEDLSNVDKL